MSIKSIVDSHWFVTEYPEERGKLRELLPEGDLDRIVENPGLLMSLHQKLYYVNYESYKNRKKGEVFLVDHPNQKEIKTITYN